MPFLLPIQTFDEPPPVAGVVVGSTELTGELTVTIGARATFAGSTELVGSLSVTLVLAGEVQGSTGLAGSLRLNDEANVFLEGTVSGSTTLEGAAPSLGTFLAGQAAGATELAGELRVKRAEEFGLTIFLDIVGEGMQGESVARYRARLLADGTEVPISSFDLNAPEGALGVSLSVSLAQPDVSLVSNASELQFDLGVWDGSAFEWVTMLAGGKLAGRELTIAFARGGPTDAVTLTLIDTVADRWTFAPEQPETLYDPDQVDEPAPPDSRNLIVNERGAGIEPVSTPVYDLTMREVLRRAYVEGCGFDNVVTNIPDFPVSQVTFSLEGGFHETVKPLLSLFEPLYFAEGNDLWIIDAGAALPAGLQPRGLPLSAVVSVTDTAPARQPLSSLIVAHRSDGRAGGDYFTERIDQESQEAGTFGVQGYTRTETERRVREYRDFDAPETIVREEVASVKVTTRDYQFNVVGRETQTDTFDALGRKGSHKRTVEALVPDLDNDGTLTLQTVSEETYTLLYRAGRSAGSDEIATTINEISGLILVDSGREYLSKPYEIPFVDAHQSGYIDPDGDQSAEFGAIRTVTEMYVREGASSEVRRQVVNHLNGGSVENTTAQTRAGSTAVSRRGQGVVRRKLTLPGAGSGRVVPTFGTGDIPGDMAIALGWRRLATLNSPPRRLSAQLPLVAFDIRRGTPAMPHSRSGVLGTYLVTATRVSGQNLGTQKQLITMSASGKELKA
ncbi:MAG: hypothetical protein ABW208_07110 [Pyrinomonadaceae bacterium]